MNPQCSRMGPLLLLPTLGLSGLAWTYGALVNLIYAPAGFDIRGFPCSKCFSHTAFSFCVLIPPSYLSNTVWSLSRLQGTPPPVFHYCRRSRRLLYGSSPTFASWTMARLAWSSSELARLHFPLLQATASAAINNHHQLASVVCSICAPFVSADSPILTAIVSMSAPPLGEANAPAPQDLALSRQLCHPNHLIAQFVSIMVVNASKHLLDTLLSISLKLNAPLCHNCDRSELTIMAWASSARKCPAPLELAVAARAPPAKRIAVDGSDNLNELLANIVKVLAKLGLKSALELREVQACTLRIVFAPITSKWVAAIMAEYKAYAELDRRAKGQQSARPTGELAVYAWVVFVNLALADLQCTQQEQQALVTYKASVASYDDLVTQIYLCKQRKAFDRNVRKMVFSCSTKAAEALDAFVRVILRTPKTKERRGVPPPGGLEMDLQSLLDALEEASL